MSPEGVVQSLIDLYPLLLRRLESGAGGPFAAAVIVGGRVVGRGTNTVIRDVDVTRHAEVNALADATRAVGGLRLADAVLATSHAPCLMCYHAAKWAALREVWYVFDYEETERLFGFRGDRRMLEDLGIDEPRLRNDPALTLRRVTDPRVDALYRTELPGLWQRSFRERCGGYDV